VFGGRWFVLASLFVVRVVRIRRIRVWVGSIWKGELCDWSDG